MAQNVILLVGEICIDFTLATATSPVKMRLGGIVHPARGLWAAGVPYAVAAVCPSYLKEEAEKYLKSHGCVEFCLVGIIDGSPNVIAIGDVREVGHQGYEALLRESKKVTEDPDATEIFSRYDNIVIFPGSFSLENIAKSILPSSNVVIDIAYDIESIDKLSVINPISDLVISTSSDLFLKDGAVDLDSFCDRLRPITNRLLLKENRGGSRLFDFRDGSCENIPAILGRTVNSVGVGDVFSAVYASFVQQDHKEAAWRGMQAATAYAQTTYPDDFKKNVQRSLSLQIDEVRGLGGTFLPWHERPQYEIYLAAPDFTYVDRTEIESAVAALSYHNFTVRRPVIENGEAERGSTANQLAVFFSKDIELLEECAILFAVPLERDPGTLIEMGMAMAQGKPVVTFDPNKENQNTMVICGSKIYSPDLDDCLNAVFESISRIRRKRS